MIEIKDVASDDFSNKLLLRYYPRSIKVSAKENFATPSRMITDTEYRHKAEYSNQTKLDDHVSIITQYFNETDILSFIHKNGAMKKLSGKIAAFNKVSIDAPITTLSLRRSYNRAWPKLSLDQIQTFLRFLDVAEGRLSTRSLPPFIYDDYSDQVITEFCKQNDDKEPVIWLDLREDETLFKRKIDLILTQIKEERLKVVGFQIGIFDRFEDYNVNLDYVYSKLHKEYVLLLLEGAYKTFSQQYSGPSKLHYHSFESFDLISPTRFQRGGGSKKGNKEIDEEFKRVKFFQPVDVSLESYGNMGMEHPAIKDYVDQNMKKVLEEIETMKNEKVPLSNQSDKLLKQLKGLSTVQQIKEGNIELNNISRRITKNDCFSYLEEKQEFGSVVKRQLRNK